MEKQRKSLRKDARDRAKKQAEELVDQLSVEEQAGLLRYDSPAVSRLKIPEYNWWNEALHGVARAGTATVFPVPIALAAAFDRKLMKEVGDCISTEGRAKYNEYQKEGDCDIYKGLTFWSPNINLFRDPRWGRGHETFGEDPYLTAQMGDAFIRGLQGEHEEFLKAAACVKHLAVHSGPEALRHEFDVWVSDKELWEYYLPAFEYCVTHSQVEGVMGGYSSLRGEPLCGSHFLIEEILRGTWGFEGYYVSDCWAIRDFHEHHKVTDTAEESAAKALKAGCDINCGCCYQQILKAYYHGLLDETDVRRSAVRALTTRLLLGMNQPTPWDHLNYLNVDTPEYEELNRKAAASSMVLLKNDGVLPIDLNQTPIVAVIGPNADSRWVLQGNYHGTPSRFVTVMEGMKREAASFPKARILYAEGSQLMMAKTERLARDDDRISEAVAVAKRSQVVLLCVGLDERYEGEAHHISTGECIGGDKEDLQFPECQRHLIEAVLGSGTPVILCVMSGSCLDLSPYADRAAAVIQTWYPGAMGGQALAEVLTGKSSPSGKLPVTFYGRDYKIPEFTDYSLKNRTYRYVKQGVLYPFGYGLTYGKTRILKAEFGGKKDGEGGYAIETERVVYVTIRNESDRKITEVVQIYKKNLTSRWEVPNTVLCGFERTDLEAGEEREIQILLSDNTFTVVNDKGKRIPDGNTYRLYVGTHGPDFRSCELCEDGIIELDVKLI